MQKFLKEKGVHHFSTFSGLKASIVERFNRTLKQKMGKYFTQNNALHYVGVLEQLVYSYNHTFHRSIRITPAQANYENEEFVWHTLYDQTLPKVTPKFKKGDLVRISKCKQIFSKSYLPNWTMEYFTVYRRIAGHPPVYKIADLDGEIVRGNFYEAEIQKITQPSDLYRIEKIVGRRGKGKKHKYWLNGWDGTKSLILGLTRHR